MKYLIILLILVGCVSSPDNEKYPLTIEGNFGKENSTYKVYVIEHEEFQLIWEIGQDEYDRIITVYYKTDNKNWLLVKEFDLMRIYEFGDEFENGYRAIGYNLAVVCNDEFSSCRDGKYLIEVR